MNTITIPKGIRKDLMDVSRMTGVAEKDLLIHALAYYLQSLKKRMDLKKELDVWEKTSDEDLLKFERSL